MREKKEQKERAKNESGQVLNTKRRAIMQSGSVHFVAIVTRTLHFRLELQVHDVQTARILPEVEQHKIKSNWTLHKY